jgi:hypothetical protein
MKYVIDVRFCFEVFNTYREAEIFCGERGIHPEEIMEMTPEEIAEFY